MLIILAVCLFNGLIKPHNLIGESSFPRNLFLVGDPSPTSNSGLRSDRSAGRCFFLSSLRTRCISKSVDAIPAGSIRDRSRCGDDQLKRNMTVLNMVSCRIGGGVLQHRKYSDACANHPQTQSTYRQVARLDLRLDGESDPSEDGMILLLRVERRIKQMRSTHLVGISPP